MVTIHGHRQRHVDSTSVGIDEDEPILHDLLIEPTDEVADQSAMSSRVQPEPKRARFCAVGRLRQLASKRAGLL